MHRNPIWLGFLLVIAVITAWFISNAISDVVEYNSLSAQTSAVEIEEWSTEKLSESHFVPKCRYRYLVDNTYYEGTTVFELRSFRNAISVNDDIMKLKERKWLVWYNPADPTHSNLDKVFPISSALSGTLMLAIFTYFVWLGRYVAKRAGE